MLAFAVYCMHGTRIVIQMQRGMVIKCVEAGLKSCGMMMAHR